MKKLLVLSGLAVMALTLSGPAAFAQERRDIHRDRVDRNHDVAAARRAEANGHPKRAAHLRRDARRDTRDIRHDRAGR